MISTTQESPHRGFGEFLDRSLEMELLRFTTAGSVDDGKSTLIGRLLHGSKAVYEDQLASVKKSRINRSTGPVDFSLLTDGLRAEREQGITIGVAYRYLWMPRRESFHKRGAMRSSRHCWEYATFSRRSTRWILSTTGKMCFWRLSGIF